MVRKLKSLFLLSLLFVANATTADLEADQRNLDVEFKLSEVGSSAGNIGLVFLAILDGAPATGLGEFPCVVYTQGNGANACNGTISEIGDGIYSFSPTSTDIPNAGNYTITVGAGSSLGYNSNVINLKVLPNDSPVLTETCVNTNPGTNSLCGMILANTTRIGTAQTFTKSSLRMASSEAFANNELQDNFAIKIIRATGGAGEGQIACICSNTGSTDWVYFCEELETLPTGTVTYGLISSPNCSHPRPVRRW